MGRQPIIFRKELKLKTCELAVNHSVRDVLRPDVTRNKAKIAFSGVSKKKKKKKK
jgi:hypothetical protein